MITSEKRFGSYVVTKSNFFHEAGRLDEGIERIGDCAITTNWIELPLLSINKYNHDTSIFRFALPHGYKQINLPIGCYLLVKAPLPEHDGTTPSVRPYANIADEHAMMKEIDDTNLQNPPYFEILCKRYDQWGMKETPQTHFLFTRTDHSYKPPGIVSNYIHKLNIGDSLSFKFNQLCQGRFHYPLPSTVRTLTMIAVGVGIAPMIQILRTIFQERECRLQNLSTTAEDNQHEAGGIEQVVLLYGVRSVKDILLKEVLDEWHTRYSITYHHNNGSSSPSPTDHKRCSEESIPACSSAVFRVVYCVGSRYTNVHWGAKSKTEYTPPPFPSDFQALLNQKNILPDERDKSDVQVKTLAELGWINQEKIQQYAFPPSDTTRVVVCGLPGVYDKLCGHGDEEALHEMSILAQLGYSQDMVIKL